MKLWIKIPNWDLLFSVNLSLKQHISTFSYTCSLLSSIVLVEYGVFARKTIPKRTQFGPIEGVLAKSGEVVVLQEAPTLKLTIESDSGEFRILDVSNERKFGQLSL